MKRFCCPLVLGLFCALAGLSGCDSSNSIVIGSKNFTEQVILGSLLAQHIENRTDLIVDRRLNLSGTFICDQALRSGGIDGYVEYTGTAFTAILQNDPIRNPREVYRRVQEAYGMHQIEWLEPLGFNNTFAIIIRAEDAQRLGIGTISEAAAFTPQWVPGFGYEFIERADGFRGLSETYGLKFRDPPKVMEIGLMYRALQEKQVDLIAGDATNGLIDALALQVLEDDQRYFPPYDAVPIFRQETLARYPVLRDVINQLAGTIDEREMRAMNYAVDGMGETVREVVNEFLEREGL